MERDNLLKLHNEIYEKVKKIYEDNKIIIELFSNMFSYDGLKVYKTLYDDITSPEYINNKNDTTIKNQIEELEYLIKNWKNIEDWLSEYGMTVINW